LYPYKQVICNEREDVKTFRQIFIQTIFYGLLIVLGLYIGFLVHWTHSGVRLMGILACIIVGFGSLLFAISLTKLFFPDFREIDLGSLFNREKYNMFKKTLGRQFKIFITTYISIWLITFVGCGYWYFSFTSTYKIRQLEKYGQIQKVKVNDIVIFHNLGRQVEFDYYFKNEKYTNRLLSDDIQIGDSVDIFFSTQNPDLVSWDRNAE